MQPVTISETEFHSLIVKRAQRLLGLVHFVSACEAYDRILVRPMLGDLHAQAVQLEEVLDAYDARNNCRWCAFRALTAAIKGFSDVSYELLHIRHATPAYQLFPIEGDFEQATQRTLEFAGSILKRAAVQTLDKARSLGLEVPMENPRERSISESLPPGRLDRNCGARRTEDVGEKVASLATDFLRLSAASRSVRAAGSASPDQYGRYLEHAVREENLRSLELRFHNLQSQYDTYVAGTQAEKEDADLSALRGHISVVFHLFRTGTMFAHHYERHIGRQKPCQFADSREPLVDSDELVGTLMKYSVAFSGLYMACAELLCQGILGRYQEVIEREVPIPQYRGFHVRPSTLVGSLVHHYGVAVEMRLSGEKYDARVPLSLLRANEKVFFFKRQHLAMDVANLNLMSYQAQGSDVRNLARCAILDLAEQGKVVIYKQPMQFPEQPVRTDGPLVDQVIAEVVRLLTLGQIDVASDIKATFKGDKRVLEDIVLLAESGYGEDKFGNDVPLPDKLAYLRDE